VQLQALKGVALIVAVKVVAEIGDFSRFTNPKQVMAYLGLIPSEHSSGGTVRRTGITKIGNMEVRRMLYEAAWAYRSNTKVGSWMLDHMSPTVTQESKDITCKDQQRLSYRYRSLVRQGKKSQVAITAVARELVGFMWDIACHFGNAVRNPRLVTTVIIADQMAAPVRQELSAGLTRGTRPEVVDHRLCICVCAGHGT
jgi:transposase